VSAVTLADFKLSLSQPSPPEGVDTALAALWWAARDEWDRAHSLVMDEGGKTCAWVHAYLHRVEGDLDNARYWYDRAEKPEAKDELAVEWDAIAKTLLTA
jgi:hypothetical protein